MTTHSSRRGCQRCSQRIGPPSVTGCEQRARKLSRCAGSTPAAERCVRGEKRSEQVVPIARKIVRRPATRRGVGGPHASGTPDGLRLSSLLLGTASPDGGPPERFYPLRLWRRLEGMPPFHTQLSSGVRYVDAA